MEEFEFGGRSSNTIVVNQAFTKYHFYGTFCFMTNVTRLNLIEQLTGYESAYRGLADVVEFDLQLAQSRGYVINQIAELILSDELAAEIEAMSQGMPRALAGQTVNEICNEVFGSTNYNCSWTENRKWLGDAIIVAASLNPA